MTEDDIKKLQSTGGDNLAATEKNILGNHLPQLWDLVTSPNFAKGKSGGGRIDFGGSLSLASSPFFFFLFARADEVGSGVGTVLDNAGFELYCDLVYADWLVQSGLASEVRFHGKRFAWFVSRLFLFPFRARLRR